MAIYLPLDCKMTGSTIFFSCPCTWGASVPLSEWSRTSNRLTDSTAGFFRVVAIFRELSWRFCLRETVTNSYYDSNCPNRNLEISHSLIVSEYKENGQRYIIRLSKVSYFVDLSEAFDSVDHYLPIKKLEHMDFHGRVLNSIQSYLLIWQGSEYRGSLRVDKLLQSEKLLREGNNHWPPDLSTPHFYLPHAFSHGLGLYGNDTSIIIRSSINEEIK